MRRRGVRRVPVVDREGVLVGIFGPEGVIYATIVMSVLVIVFAEIPKTSTGKIQKFVLREKARSAAAIDT